MCVYGWIGSIRFGTQQTDQKQNHAPVSTVLYFEFEYNTIPGTSLVQYSTAQHSAVQHSAVQHSAVQHSAVQHSTARMRMDDIFVVFRLLST